MVAILNGRLDVATLAAVPGGLLRADAADAWTRVRADAGLDLRPTSLHDTYRPYYVQERIFRERYTTAWVTGIDPRRWLGQTWWRRPGTASAAVPGTSNHGWGVAVDVTGLGGFAGSAYAHLAAVAPAHGWSNRAGRTIGEAWHWEYSPATDTHPTPAPAAQPITPTPAGSSPTTPLEVIDMDQALIRAFKHFTGFPPSQAQLELFTTVWMLNGEKVTAEQIRDSAAGQVAQAFRDALGRNPESQATVAAYLAQFHGDIAAIRAALAASPEGLAHR